MAKRRRRATLQPEGVLKVKRAARRRLLTVSADKEIS
jgi:hypothetical protein